MTVAAVAALVYILPRKELKVNRKFRKAEAENAHQQRGYPPVSKKTYQQYALKLRKVEDADIIAMIDAERAKGYQTSEAIKNLIRNK